MDYCKKKYLVRRTKSTAVKTLVWFQKYFCLFIYVILGSRKHLHVTGFIDISKQLSHLIQRIHGVIEICKRAIVSNVYNVQWWIKPSQRVQRRNYSVTLTVTCMTRRHFCARCCVCVDYSNKLISFYARLSCMTNRYEAQQRNVSIELQLSSCDIAHTNTWLDSSDAEQSGPVCVHIKPKALVIQLKLGGQLKSFNKRCWSLSSQKLITKNT